MRREEIDKERGSAVDVGGVYNTAFLTMKQAGARDAVGGVLSVQTDPLLR